MKKIMKKIMIILGILLLMSVETYAGLSGITSKVTSVRADVLNLVKVLAGFGLLTILGIYLLSKDETRTFHWKWFLAALALGSFAQLLQLVGLQ